MSCPCCVGKLSASTKNDPYIYRTTNANEPTILLERTCSLFKACSDVDRTTSTTIERCALATKRKIFVRSGQWMVLALRSGLPHSGFGCEFASDAAGAVVGCVVVEHVLCERSDVISWTPDGPVRPALLSMLCSATYCEQRPSSRTSRELSPGSLSKVDKKC